jgi:hypothetical protein
LAEDTGLRVALARPSSALAGLSPRGSSQARVWKRTSGVGDAGEVSFVAFDGGARLQVVDELVQNLRFLLPLQLYDELLFLALKASSASYTCGAVPDSSVKEKAAVFNSGALPILGT